jgi:hypothetical protein
LVQRYPRDADLPDLTLDDPTAVALLTSHLDDGSSPSLERLYELVQEKLEAQGRPDWPKPASS